MKKGLFFKVAVLRSVFCVTILCGLVNVYAQVRNCPDGKQLYRTSIRHIESGGVGYDDGYTTLEGFFASDPSRREATHFFDVRGHVFDNGQWAGNIGVGLRALVKARVYGINCYYDYRNTDRLGSSQIGVGLETLGEFFDFRINSYLPFGSKISDPYDAVFASFSEHFALISAKYYSAMGGADAEFGFHLGRFESSDFYAGIGPYYFVGNIDPSAFGVRARISSTFNDIVTLEISNSYDRTFGNNFQGSISFNFAFGPHSKVKKQQGHTCRWANTLNDRMLQPVHRQEVIVINKTSRTDVAIDPTTGLPYYFVFVNNTSSSNGTYESPYPTLVQAQDNSSVNDIIYVFPGDGTTTGMNAGIALKANQKFWGSGIAHPLQTTQGNVIIPAQSSTAPIITNLDIDTEGNAITLATNNAISGFTITSALNDAIYGSDAQDLEVSSCLFENTTTYAIEAAFSGDTSISLTNNQFLDNVNGVYLRLNGSSTIVCTDNTFEGQTSISSVPIEISANENSFSALIKNNLFDGNTTGGVRFGFDSVVDANINFLNNTITDNGSGSQSILGSSFVIISSGTTESCTITMNDNTFSNNESNALYLHTSGEFTTLQSTVLRNTITDNGGSGMVFATPAQTLTLLVTDNTVARCNDNAISVIAPAVTATGTITIEDNAISDIGNASNGIAINQDFTQLNLIIANNEINRCEGTGIISYAPTGIASLTLSVADNIITGCENASSNAASGLDIEQFVDFEGSVTNNTFSDNTGTAVFIGSTLPTPTACLQLVGNDSSTGYLLSNPVDGTFYLRPLDVDSVNIGTITTSGDIQVVASCPSSE